MGCGGALRHDRELQRLLLHAHGTMEKVVSLPLSGEQAFAKFTHALSRSLRDLIVSRTMSIA